MSVLAVVFPGQGSQHIGMLADLYQQYQVVRHSFDEAAEALGYDLWALCQEPAMLDKLNTTTVTQPAMLCAGVAVWRVWQQQAPKPVVAAGHSLGEYSALCAAGVIDFYSGIKLVEQRAKLMQQALPAEQGAMAAVLGLAAAEVVDCCQQAAVASGKIVEAVNFNSPEQVVIAGFADAVGLACKLLKDAGAKRVMLLPISVPAHSSIMRSCSARFSELLHAAHLSQPQFAVLQNAQNQVYDNAEAIRAALVAQLYSPVDFYAGVKMMAADYHVDCIIELGAGKVLSGLIKRIDKNINSLSVADCAQLAKAWDLFA